MKDEGGMMNDEGGKARPELVEGQAVEGMCPELVEGMIDETTDHESRITPHASPFETQFVEALDIHTAYITAGEPVGRPVLLLHGMSASADTYRETLAALAADRWLIAPDIPGFGQSEMTRPYTMDHLVEWLAAFREALDLPPMDLVGHSFGGALATSFALSYPEDVVHLALAAPALLVGLNYPDYLKKMSFWLRLPEAGTAVSQSNRMVQQAVRSSSFAPNQIGDEIWERRVQEYNLARATADVLKLLAFYDVRAELPRLTLPVCAIWGENDPVVLPGDAEKLRELIPNFTAHLLPECGHIVMLEKLDEFVEILHSFWGDKD